MCNISFLYITTFISLYLHPCYSFLIPTACRLKPLFKSHTSYYRLQSKRILLLKPSSDNELSPPLDRNQFNSTNLSRRDTFLLLVGGTAYAKLAYTVLTKIQRGEAYPPEHENRAANTFKVALSSSVSFLNKQSAHNITSYLPRPLRILEVGVGSSCRTFVRGMYDSAIREVVDLTDNQSGVINGIEFMGVDIDIPQTEQIIKNARDHINSIDPTISFPITLDIQSADITKGLPFPDGYFGKFHLL